MCKFFLLVVAMFACLAAWTSAAPSVPLVYTNAAAEYPLASSGYEYQHTVQTPDYFTHASVSAPLNGIASIAPPLVRAALSEPLAYATAAQLW